MSDKSFDSDVAVEALVGIMGDIFESHFIFDPEVRRTVARTMLNSGKLVEYLGHKYELLQRAMNVGTGEKKDPFVMVKPTVNVASGLTHSQRADIAAVSPDVDVRFLESAAMPHGKAHALRTIQRAQALNLVSHHAGTVLDIGGNYLQEVLTRDKRTYQIHSCTMLEGEIEHHRQMQRDVSIDIGQLGEPDYCTAGAENCHIRAPHGMCIHALTAIDPALWVKIFRNHGLEYVVCYFHYDVAIEVDDAGFMPAVDMHWARVDDDIHCHFDGDSSHPYVHKRSWMVKYGSTWTSSEDDWEYVLYYEVEYVKDGIAKSSFTRLEKSTLGYQENLAQFRYLDVDECVDLLVPKFNPSYGKPVSDPHAYDSDTVRVTMPLFSHVLRYGISNDTNRPDLPLTFDAVRDQCFTFNHVRRVNGTSLTVSYRLGSQTIDDVALGMYLLIVKRAAMNRMKYTAYTSNMLRLQRQWGEESVLKLLAKAVSYTAVAPFVMLAGSFTDAVDVMTVYLRQSVGESLVTTSAADVLPYRIMNPIRTVAGTLTDTLHNEFPAAPKTTFEPQEVSPRRFYEVFKDTLTADQRARIEKYIETTEPPSDVAPGGGDSVVVDADSESVVADKDNDVGADAGGQDTEVKTSVMDRGDGQGVAHLSTQQVVTRDEWNQQYDEFQDFLEKRELPPLTVKGHTFTERTDGDRVWDYAKEAVREYMMYNYDVGLHTLEHARDQCRDTWGGSAPRSRDVQALNIKDDAGICYFRVEDNVIEGMDITDRHAVVLDPVTLDPHFTFVKSGKCMAVGVKSALVFTAQSLKIFNSFAIAKRAQKLLGNFPRIDAIAKLVDGVPGCGKTYNIIQEFTIRDVIVTTVKETRDDTFMALVNDSRFVGMEHLLKDRVRTMDSSNIHGLPRARTMFADEGLMEHGGGLIMSTASCKPKVMKTYGDSAQIAFIDRGSRIGNLHFQSLFYWTQIVEANESSRCPADAMWLSSQFYPVERRSRIKTCSPIRRSITFTYEPNVKATLWESVVDPWIVVTVLRGDMGDLLDRCPDTYVRGTTLRGSVKSQTGGHSDGVGSDLPYDGSGRKVPVFSVHEVQGRTKPFVQAMRLSPFNPDVINSPEHANVLFTRHTLRCNYASSKDVGSDMCSTLAHRATMLSDEELDEMIIQTPKWLQDRMMSQLKKYARYLN